MINDSMQETASFLHVFQLANELLIHLMSKYE